LPIGPLSITIAAIDQITDITITDSGYDCSTTPAGGNINIAAVKQMFLHPYVIKLFQDLLVLIQQQILQVLFKVWLLEIMFSSTRYQNGLFL
jgi:hypothetical protein